MVEFVRDRKMGGMLEAGIGWGDGEFISVVVVVSLESATIFPVLWWPNKRRIAF